MKHQHGYKEEDKDKADSMSGALDAMLEGMRKPALPVALELGDVLGI